MKNLGKGAVFIMLLTLKAVPIQAEIISAKSMKDVQIKIDTILTTQKPQDILVAFDIDMTLIQPDHPAVYYPTLKKYVDVYNGILGQLTPEQKDLVTTLTTQIVPQRLIEDKTLEIINGLQRKEIKMIALTSSLTGKIRKYPRKMIMIRRDQLQKMGIDFTKSLNPYVAVWTLSHVKKYAGDYPMFYHGILSTNGKDNISKGDILVELLRHVGHDREDKTRQQGYYPKVIILVDNKKRHLENVEKSLEAYDPSVQFLGIEYRKAYAYASQDISKGNFEKFWREVAHKAKCLLPE